MGSSSNGSYVAVQCWDVAVDLERGRILGERFLCGKLPTKGARSLALGNVRAEWPKVTVRWLNPKSEFDEYINLGPCPMCRKLSAMEPDERTYAIEERAAIKAAKFAEMSVKSKAKRAAELVEIRAAVAIAREDAHAALDAWSDGCRKLETGKPAGSTISTDALLLMAVVAYQLENPRSGGDRLWVFRMTTASNRSGDIVCRFCREVQESNVFQGDTANVVDDTRFHATRCALRYLVGMPLHANEFASDDDGCECSDDGTEITKHEREGCDQHA